MARQIKRAPKLIGAYGGAGRPVDGLEDIQKALGKLKLSMANRVARPGVNAAASMGAKIVKSKIPGRLKSVRKAIGWRSLKTKYNGGVVGSKIGGGVGKRRNKVSTTRKNKRGVGIDEKNVHWWFLGTAERSTGKRSVRRKIGGKSVTTGFRSTGNKVRRTGRMPAAKEGVAQMLAMRTGDLIQIMRKKIAIALVKEINKAKAKQSS